MGVPPPPHEHIFNFLFVSGFCRGNFGVLEEVILPLNDAVDTAVVHLKLHKVYLFGRDIYIPLSCRYYGGTQ